MTKRQGKLWWVEWLRVFGCVAVVLIHCFATLLDNATVAEIGLTRAFVWTEVLVICCRWAVPAFLMVTGALLLDPAHEIGLPKVRGYVGRMAGVLLTFGTLFALMELVFDARSFSLAMLPEALLDVLQGRGWAHMWYIYDLLGVYLLLPVLRAFSAGSDERSYDIVLCVLFMLSLVVPTVNAATGLSLDTLVWLGSSVFYVLLGWRLRSRPLPLTPSVLAGAAGTVAGALVAGGGIAVLGSYCSWAWVSSSPLVALQAASVFTLAQGLLDRPMKEGGPAMLVASLSFGIYVLHPVVANLLYKALGWASVPLPPVAFEFVTFAIVFGGGLVLAACAKRLPVVGRLM